MPLPACSPEPDPYFEDGTWAAAHRAQIERDCDHRFVCAQRTKDHITENAYDNCLTEQAMKLNNSPDMQLNFVLGLNRCPGDDPCRYVDCADSGYLSYGQQQLDKIRYACQQEVQCAIDNQHLSNDPTAAYDTCVVQSVLSLDTFTNEAQMTFQASFYPCLPMTSCAFVVCFGH